MMKNLNYLKFLQQFIVLSLLALLSTQVLAGKRTTTYMHTDALGSVVAASDEDGNLLWRKQYMPFGSEINRDPTLKELSYTGKKFDAELGLSYSGARYYDPSLGRFGGIDPVTALESVEPNPMMFNRYAYANNNPYKFIDPDGRASRKIVGFEKRIDWLPSEIPFNTKTIFLETVPPSDSLWNTFFDGLNTGTAVGLANQSASMTRSGQRAMSIFKKIDRYSLNFKHAVGKNKARVFMSALGFDGSNKSKLDLTKQIFQGFNLKKLEFKGKTEYGDKYNQVMKIKGPNGKTADVLTAWIKGPDNVIRLTTAYVKKK